MSEGMLASECGWAKRLRSLLLLWYSALRLVASVAADQEIRKMTSLSWPTTKCGEDGFVKDSSTNRTLKSMHHDGNIMTATKDGSSQFTLLEPVWKPSVTPYVASFWVRQSLSPCLRLWSFSLRGAHWGNPYAKSLRGLTQVRVLLTPNALWQGPCGKCKVRFLERLIWPLHRQLNTNWSTWEIKTAVLNILCL